MSDPRQIVPRKHASPMNTPGIRIREYWNGTTSSSDGPFFRASDRAAKRGDIDEARRHEDDLGPSRSEIGKHPVRLSITHISSCCDFGAEFDIRESREAAPDDSISRWRIAGPGQVAT
ncbi:hypothetical protein ABIB66_008893 [Bradyrhizobium sp. F1.13.3]